MFLLCPSLLWPRIDDHVAALSGAAAPPSLPSAQAQGWLATAVAGLWGVFSSVLPTPSFKSLQLNHLNGILFSRSRPMPRTVLHSGGSDSVQLSSEHSPPATLLLTTYCPIETALVSSPTRPRGRLWRLSSEAHLLPVTHAPPLDLHRLLSSRLRPSSDSVSFPTRFSSPAGFFCKMTRRTLSSHLFFFSSFCFSGWSRV